MPLFQGNECLHCTEEALTKQKTQHVQPWALRKWGSFVKASNQKSCQQHTDSSPYAQMNSGKSLWAREKTVQNKMARITSFAPCPFLNHFSPFCKAHSIRRNNDEVVTVPDRRIYIVCMQDYKGITKLQAAVVLSPSAAYHIVYCLWMLWDEYKGVETKTVLFTQESKLWMEQRMHGYKKWMGFVKFVKSCFWNFCWCSQSSVKTGKMSALFGTWLTNIYYCSGFPSWTWSKMPSTCVSDVRTTGQLPSGDQGPLCPPLQPWRKHTSES